MDVKFTFEDGGEYLAHYGKVGMRWRKGRKTPEQRAKGHVTGVQKAIVNAAKPNATPSAGVGRAARASNAAKRVSKFLAKHNAQQMQLATRKAKINAAKLNAGVGTDKKRKKLGAKERKRSYSSKAGLSAKYARKVASANSEYSSIKNQRRQAKLLGYGNSRNRG